MLIIINSMHKCGSTWFHNYVVRCLISLGYPDAHTAVRGFPVQLGRRTNPGALSGTTLSALLDAARDRTFVIKAHVPPNPELLEAIGNGKAAAIFIIRHPADIVRSALAFGEYCRSHSDNEPISPYAAFFEPIQAATYVAPCIDWAEQWLTSRQRHIVTRYENLFSSDTSLLAAVHALFPDSAAASKTTLQQLKPERLTAKERDWLRINLTRYPALTPEVAAICNEWARRIGYY
jgi:hypothetical protein